MRKMAFGGEIFVFMRLECLGAGQLPFLLRLSEYRFAPLFPCLLGSGSCCDQAGLGEGEDDTRAKYLCAAASFCLNLRISLA